MVTISKSIFYIKLVHSLLFFLIGICTIYVLAAAALDQITILTWAAFGVVIIELLILLWNDWQCPLTLFAESNGAVSGSVADLYLPKWLSDHLFQVFGILFVVITILLIWRLIW